MTGEGDLAVEVIYGNVNIYDIYIYTHWQKKTDHLRKLLKMKFKCELRGNFRNNIIGIVFILKIIL